jgi:hypothetical protein
MNDFLIWFKLGMDHLLEPGALDHFLILSILAVTYLPKDWKRTFVLILAFTAGHATSMLLAANLQLPLPEKLIEAAIALTILFSALLQFPWNKRMEVPLILSLLSFLFFGLIHGLGFSLQLKSLLGDGTQVLLPLLYFNLGLETIQNIFVIAVMGFSLLLTSSIKLSGAIFKYIIICLSGLIALFIAAERLLQL